MSFGCCWDTYQWVYLLTKNVQVKTIKHWKKSHSLSTARSKCHALNLQNHFSQGHVCSQWHSPDLAPTTMKKQELHKKCIIVNHVLLIVYVEGGVRTIIKKPEEKRHSIHSCNILFPEYWGWFVLRSFWRLLGCYHFTQQLTCQN